MTATKNNSIFKKLGALAMAMCLTCALAVSAVQLPFRKSLTERS